MAEKIVDLKVNIKEAEKQIKTLDQQIEELEDTVSDANRELNRMEAELAGVTGSSGKDIAKRKQLNEKIKKTKAFIKQETTALKENKKLKTKLNKDNAEYNKKLKEQAKNHNEVNKNISQVIGGSSLLDKATGGLFSRFTGLIQVLTGTRKSLNLVRLAFIGLGIPAILVALGSLVAYFKQSEEGQNRFTKVLNQAKAVIGNVTELLYGLGEGISNAFSALFSGEPRKALSELRKGFDTTVDRAKNLGKNIREDVAIAGKLADEIAKADKIDRKLIVDRQKANAKVNELRTKAYDTERFNEQERIAFLERAIKIEDEITNKEIESARLRFEAKRNENNLTSLARKEDLDEQAELEKKVFELEAKKINRQREVQNQRQMLIRKQTKAEQKAAEDAAKAEQDRVDAIADILNAEAEAKEERLADTELKKVELEESRRLAELEQLNATEAEKQRIRDYYTELKQIAMKEDAEIEKAQREKDLEEAQAVADAKLAMQLSMVSATQSAIRALGGLLKEGSDAAKATALLDIAAGTATGFINGLNIAQKTAKAQGPAAALTFPIFYATQVAAVLSAAGRAKAVLKSGKGDSAPTSASPRGASAPQAPAFNIVGSSPTNQLAQAIGEQEQSPIKAFVVSSEVSNQQALDRNIEQTASIG